MQRGTAAASRSSPSASAACMRRFGAHPTAGPISGGTTSRFAEMSTCSALLSTFEALVVALERLEQVADVLAARRTAERLHGGAAHPPVVSRRRRRRIARARRLLRDSFDARGQRRAARRARAVTSSIVTMTPATRCVAAQRRDRDALLHVGRNAATARRRARKR